MELAARLGGGHDAELCQAALGVDLNGLALAAALGEPVSVPEAKPIGGACVSFLVAPPASSRTSTGSSRRRPRRGSSLRASTAGSDGSSRRFGAGATARASSSRRATRATRHSRAPSARPT